MNIHLKTASYHTNHGAVRITRGSANVDGGVELEALRRALDAQRGLILSSGYEYPGRYTRWDIGFCNPPLSIEGRGCEYSLVAHNARGQLLLRLLRSCLATAADFKVSDTGDYRIDMELYAAQPQRSEEERTRRPSALSIVRAVRDVLASPSEAHLGLYGAFGYDLVFALDDLFMRRPRSPEQRDMVLFLPDELLVLDRHSGVATRLTYDFEYDDESTEGLSRSGQCEPFEFALGATPRRDHEKGEFAKVVERANHYFARGDLFEVTPSQVFCTPCAQSPSQLFARLCEQNPAPYGILMNLGQQEFLVGASPEMYVRVQGRRVETCPIAGTIARGRDALGDEAQIRSLLESEKEEAELTMCTDVDRNDKARICEPGSVRVLGRRQIEMYSRLIHTVDHVEGTLREDYDALDAFMTHLWAVTVTGAPKLAAMQFIEDHERSPRRFYGGAVGCVGFDGHLNTGIAIRTLRIERGIAELRVGATLLFGCDPMQEEAETELKASALHGLLESCTNVEVPVCVTAESPGEGKHVLVVDHQDSFVHTLSDYFRQTGARVTTVRYDLAVQRLATDKPDLCVLSPGPGRPQDFAMSSLFQALLRQGTPTFGVCLGLQGMVEYFGGCLGQLATPVHGRTSDIAVVGGALFDGLPGVFRVGRYHSLYADRRSLPDCLQITAVLNHADRKHESDMAVDSRLVMAVEHRELPFAAVQFHPESILSAEGMYGLRIVCNVFGALERQSQSLRCRSSNTARPSSTRTTA